MNFLRDYVVVVTFAMAMGGNDFFVPLGFRSKIEKK